MLTATLKLYRNSFSGLSREIWLLSLVTLINRSGTMVIPFLTIYLTQHMGFTLGQAGWVMSCFGLGSALGSLLGGRLTDRFGFYPVIFWSLLGSGLMFLLLMNMESFTGICVTVFFLSIVADSFRPASMASVGSYSQPENYTRSVSLIRMAVNLGFSMGPAIGGILAFRLGYDWLFIADGLTCIAASFLFLFALRNRRRPAQKPAGSVEEPVRSPYRDKDFLFFLGIMLLVSIAFMQLFSTIPVFWKESMFLNEDQIGLLMAMNGLMIAVMEMPLVYSIEGRVPRFFVVGLGAALIGISYIIYPILGPWMSVAVISTLAVTLGEMANFPFSNSFALSRSGKANMGAYMGLYTMVFSVSHILSPLLGMQVADRFGFGALWYLMGGLCLLAVFGLFHLNRRMGRG